jgi:hypothetical protein
MQLSLLVGHKIDISTEICAKWRAHPVPQTHAMRGEMPAAAGSNIVDLLAYARKRVATVALVQPSEPR